MTNDTQARPEVGLREALERIRDLPCHDSTSPYFEIADAALAAHDAWIDAKAQRAAERIVSMYVHDDHGVMLPGVQQVRDVIVDELGGAS